MTYDVIHGDCLEVMRGMDAASVDAIVTDPPYGLSFMGKKWDYDVPTVDVWAECLRVLKPGGHLLAFAGTRTQHRMAVRIEDAGFEIRDMIAWVYGSGFPKSLNIGDGRGTALKPALEPITLARKPLIGTVAENVAEHGTGALNVDGCRVGDNAGWSYPNGRGGSGWHGRESLAANLTEPMASTQGRWPANLIHDGSEEVAGLFPVTASGVAVRRNSGGDTFGGDKPKPAMDDMGYGDSGSAARFFYCAKADRSDREDGLEGMPRRSAGTYAQDEWSRQNMGSTPDAMRAGVRNHHPTVKPTDLMRYLCRLITPPGGVILDPFAGSGSTGRGAVIEGFSFIGIEREAEYVEIARRRIARAAEQPSLFEHAEL